MKQVILGYFPSEAEADVAAEAIRAWDELDDDVKFDSIGILALDQDGKVKTQKLGKRTIGRGAGIGLALAIITPVGLGAVVAGGVIGALHKKGLGVSPDQRDTVAAELAGGRAAVGVLVKNTMEAGAVTEKLAGMGAKTGLITISDELDAAGLEVSAESAAVADRQEHARG
jgi:hypothetical protein